MNDGTLYRLTAFSNRPDGGNPAGVWVGETLPADETMQAIAREVGYSETAFVAPSEGPHRTIRYFSPAAEVSFCGHATIATGVALGHRSGEGSFALDTRVGAVEVRAILRAGQWQAQLRSVAPQQRPLPATLRDAALQCLGWDGEDLDPALPPALAYAGAWHLVLAVTREARLAALDYDFEALRSLMLEAGLTTLQLVRRLDDHRFEARNPFPVGGVVEDPATGAAAAALAGYLRDAGLLPAPASLTVLQGHHLGRPSQIDIEFGPTGGILIRGAAALLSVDAGDA